MFVTKSVATDQGGFFSGIHHDKRTTQRHYVTQKIGGITAGLGKSSIINCDQIYSEQLLDIEKQFLHC